jgi:hypothetical protein
MAKPPSPRFVSSWGKTRPRAIISTGANLFEEFVDLVAHHVALLGKHLGDLRIAISMANNSATGRGALQFRLSHQQGGSRRKRGIEGSSKISLACAQFQDSISIFIRDRQMVGTTWG